MIEHLSLKFTKTKDSFNASKKDCELKVEEFEKDEDENFHIDFIHSMANIRANNYGLSPLDWVSVKIKAG